MAEALEQLIEACTEEERLAVLTAAACVAWADGRLYAELGALRKACMELRLRPHRLKSVMREGRMGRLQFQAPKSEAGRKLALHYALLVAAADRKIKPAEFTAACELARGLGLSEEQVRSELASLAPGVTFHASSRPHASATASPASPATLADLLKGVVAGPVETPLARTEKTSRGALIAANLIPLLPVIFLGWDAGDVVMVYWWENVVIGFYNVLKMALAKGGTSSAQYAPKVFLIPFFCIHFGGFCAVHGLFLLSFFGGNDAMPDHDHWPGPLVFIGLLVSVMRSMVVDQPLGALLVVGALLVSHGISFVQNYLIRGECRNLGAGLLMFLPYGRVVVMHVVIIVFGIFTHLLGSPLPMLLGLIGIKLAIDLKMHRVTHDKILRVFKSAH